MSFHIRPSGLFASLMLMALAPFQAQAAWPNDKPIRMIVPYSAGGASDTLGRMIAARLGTSLKQTVVVENKPGAGSMLGSQFVSRADPDGYTFLLGSISNVLNTFFYKEPLYNLSTDLAPVAQVITIPNYLAVGKKVPVKDVAELIVLAKRDPEALSCSTSGIGSSPYLSCELLKVMSGAKIVNVPFKGGTEAIQAVLGDQTTMFFSNEALPYITADQVRVLGVTTSKRSSYLPDVPTIGETLPGYDVTAWYGVWAPAGTPKPIVDRVSAEINELLKTEGVRKTLTTLGAEAAGSTPEAFGQYVQSELQRWKRLMDEMKVVPQ
ncbi:Bug family tripartite tricarboxylate transporter substrate binding protein [Bordetella sp. 02P26C-1]|uniref:Bug family tripartite tricarboxylate transporter substrate binding protein n=1 Tax=Bordetella sp. 02P26C-1 TaxID=2683195 RepID=UPI0013523DBC|nr:tripartite tricarboxylate transporter substrate binding protein [Bordetella sp. 02P26C-1]MVW77825.1 tripartite tricarboxylate transporter substrate binding protein [Bordetella sp. 02P26C-1]